MDSQRIQSAVDLLSGRTSGAWQTRAACLFEQIQTVFEINPRLLRVVPVPSEPPSNTHRVYRVLGRDRSEAQAVAHQVLDAFFSGSLNRLSSLLAENVWAAWPNGRMARHPQEDLRRALSPRTRPSESQVRIHDWRVYHYGEFDQILVADLAPIFDAVLDLKSAVIVTARIESDGIEPVRVLLALARDSQGQFRSRNLPLIAPDDAYLASVKIGSYEESQLKTSETVIRALVLGPTKQLRSHAGQLSDRVWFRGTLNSLDEMILQLEQRPLTPANTETAFMGSRLERYADFSRLLGREQKDAFEQGAASFQSLPLHQLFPDLVISEVGEFDPRTRRVQPRTQIKLVLFRFEDPHTAKQTHKVAGIFL
jgi:hypothetical protein